MPKSEVSTFPGHKHNPIKRHLYMAKGPWGEFSFTTAEDDFTWSCCLMALWGWGQRSSAVSWFWPPRVVIASELTLASAILVCLCLLWFKKCGNSVRNQTVRHGAKTGPVEYVENMTWRATPSMSSSCFEESIPSGCPGNANRTSESTGTNQVEVD